MPSNLDNKINSYAIETGVNFDQPVVSPPVQTGTVTSTNPNDWTLLGNLAVYEPNVGPIGGGGSWKFAASTDGTQSRLRSTSSSIVSRINDSNFSVGFWLKVNSYTPVSGTGYVLQVWAPSQTLGYAINAINNLANNENSLIFTNAAGNNIFLSQPLAYNTWFYVAIRRNGNNWELYFNGQLVFTETRTSSSSTASTLFWGPNGITNAAINVNISNWYVSQYSTIDATAISEIWTIGNTAPVSVNYSASPMTASAQSVDVSLKLDNVFLTTPALASALMTEPTIATTTGDHTEITTSIIVSATFPSNISVVARKNINFILATTFNASIELINNVIISTGTDDSFSAAEFIASAEMMPARVAESPMIASATMPDPTISVPINYFKLVKDLNPYLYINNGQSESNIINYGYQNGTFTKGTELTILTDGGTPLNLVAEGKSWKGSSASNSNAYLTFETTNYADSFNNLLGTGTFAYEIWTRPLQFPDGILAPNATNSFAILNSEKLELTLEDYYVQDTGTGRIIYPRYLALRIFNTLTTFVELTSPIDSSPLTLNNWNHIIINVYQSGINPNQRLVQLWINGTIIINQNISFATWTDNTNKENYILGSNAESGLSKLADMYYDELAIYSSPLTNSQIIQHYNFINNLSPNYTHIASTLDANSESGDHQFVVISNVTAIATPITSSALFVDPAILAIKNVSNSITALTASALNTDVTVYYGWTIYPTPIVAFAEVAPAYFLSSYYYQYIQNNFAPYRYVTFDSSAPYLDYGSDTDYSVANVVINGTIVNPDFGINGKSVKSTGTYTNGAAILKESEHDDTWGTGNNSWHSAFWMRRALDDTSTGLRVLWNLNGYADNQNIIVYHYQNKLHVQINGQDDAAITISSANNVNIFDYERHHIVIKSHHNNNQNTLTLFVDGIQVATQNIGTYAITTINGALHVGPNDESNNFPRLGIGTLITPFGFTALPVVPSNISVYFDEVYWDKNDITLTQIINQFNAMPDQNNENVLAEQFIANAESIMPAISTQAILSIDPATASAEFVDPILYIERFIVTTANLMEASALMAEAKGFVPVNINADVMIASAVFDSAGIIITIPGPTMYASALLKSENLILSTTSRFGTSVVTNTFRPYRMMSPWLAYLRATDANSILPLREVK
jgi:hypothetical protein